MFGLKKWINLLILMWSFVMALFFSATTLRHNLFGAELGWSMTIVKVILTVIYFIPAIIGWFLKKMVEAVFLGTPLVFIASFSNGFIIYWICFYIWTGALVSLIDALFSLGLRKTAQRLKLAKEML